MISKHSILANALSAAFLMISSLAHSASDDRICLGRVCLGDDVLTLTELPWQPVQNPVGKRPLAGTRLSPKARAWVEQRFRLADGAFDALAPYLLIRRIDAEGLRALRGIVAVCEGFTVADRFRATYFSKEGDKTVVTFEPVGDADQPKPRFVVSTISRMFAGATVESLRVLRADISKRYAGYSTYAGATRPGVRFLEHGRQGPTLTLLQPYGGEATRGMKLRRNAACFGAQDTK